MLNLLIFQKVTLEMWLQQSLIVVWQVGMGVLMAMGPLEMVEPSKVVVSILPLVHEAFYHI
jgi:hypothetical protein